MELIKVGHKTYYLKNVTNVGVYQLDEQNVILIDSGNDADTGKKILKLITEQGWQVKGIINTHSHADHIGGNHIIQERTGCPIYSFGIEGCFIQYPNLEPTMLYGSYPFKELNNKFLQAKSSKVTQIDNDNLFPGISIFSLKGHSPEMIGVRTSDDVMFLGDALFSTMTITKYHFFYLYNVAEFLQTLNMLETCRGVLFIPSHCEATKNIDNLIQINRNKVAELTNFIFENCRTPITFETLLKKVFENYSLIMNANQYVLIGSTVKAYLTYLNDQQKIKYEFQDNQMLWSQINT